MLPLAMQMLGELVSPVFRGLCAFLGGAFLDGSASFFVCG
jgi:hypothetical protein